MEEQVTSFIKIFKKLHQLIITLILMFFFIIILLVIKTGESTLLPNLLFSWDLRISMGWDRWYEPVVCFKPFVAFSQLQVGITLLHFHSPQCLLFPFVWKIFHVRLSTIFIFIVLHIKNKQYIVLWNFDFI